MKTILLTALIVSSVSTSAWADERCKALASADFSGVTDAPLQIRNSALIEASADTPTYCLIEGNVTPQIELELRLPESHWNGKFLAVANAMTGDECNAYLKRAYACMPLYRAAKKGRNDAQLTSMWIGDPKARLDYVRSTHILGLAGKALVNHYYAAPPGKSYLMGCSAGGTRAMIQAQSFPWDFDGIVAGAPSFDTAEFLMRAVWTAESFLDKNGQQILGADDIQILHRAVLAQCDRDDGVADGIVGNPVGCQFDPGKLLCKAGAKVGCLTSPQVEAVRRIYTGPTTSAGLRLSPPGVLAGSELGWPNLLGQKLFDFMQPYFTAVFYGASPGLKSRQFDFDRDYTRLGLGAVFAPPTNPDLRHFKSAGAKLLMYQGGNDIAQVAGGVVDYYRTVERTMGGRAPTQDFFRLFMVPGMDHCTGGAGAYAIDYLSYLEAWVEHGKAPDIMVGAHVNATDPALPVSFTRPVYPYPLYAKYKGKGDPNDAANFAAVAPRSESPARH